MSVLRPLIVTISNTKGRQKEMYLFIYCDKMKNNFEYTRSTLSPGFKTVFKQGLLYGTFISIYNENYIKTCIFVECTTLVPELP